MRFALASLLTHGLLVGTMAWILAHDSGHVEGSAGLSGPTRTRFDVTMDSVKPVKTVAKAPPPPPIREGLPVNVKNEKVKEIDNPPPERAGQAGSGTEVAAKIGDSDRTNRLGLYLQKMTRKIQSNLGPAGYLQFSTHAMLLLDLHRDGTISKITVVESSGDIALDRLAIRAVQKSIPFDPWENDQPVRLPVVFR
jgi:TonB family protein